MVDKKVYEKPELITLGDIAELTMQHGHSFVDVDKGTTCGNSCCGDYAS